MKRYSFATVAIACAVTASVTALAVDLRPTPEPFYELLAVTETDVYSVDHNLTLTDCRNAHADIPTAICVPQTREY